MKNPFKSPQSGMSEPKPATRAVGQDAARAEVEDVEEAPAIPDAQVAPRRLSAGEAEAWLMVDAVRFIGDRLVVAGWRSGDVNLEIREDGAVLPAREFSFARPDVSRHLDLASTHEAGFALLVEVAGSGGLELHWTVNGPEDAGSQSLAPTRSAAEGEDPTFGPLEGLLAYCTEPFTAEWRRLVAKLPEGSGGCAAAKAYIEAAYAFKGSASFLLVGWAAGTQDTLVWVEDDYGRCYPLEGAVRTLRQDVYEAFGAELGVAALESGLLLAGDGGDGQLVHTLSIKALTGFGVELLARSGTSPLAGDPMSAARVLFGIGPLNDAWPARVERLDMPLLERMIGRAQAAWPGLPVLARECGSMPVRPIASVVVPLYGRSDFVEDQMLEWSRDPWIRANAELVYVVDDPALVEPFRHQAEELYRLYGVPFRWVWGGANRGFSGANNLGADHAHGEYLLFLNSDVFPRQPGWLQPMVEALRTRPRVGAVAPRLLFAEGGIQHAGMRFGRLEEYGVWINQHPNIGLDPALDPHRSAAVVPAVTGACLLVRRADFDRVGQWDTGYLIGDFEDSDLCLKLRQAGLQTLYMPEVELTHLERQSFVGLGAGEFRTRVTLWNAVRHQHRWHHLLENDAANSVVQA